MEQENGEGTEWEKGVGWEDADRKGERTGSRSLGEALVSLTSGSKCQRAGSGDSA